MVAVQRFSLPGSLRSTPYVLLLEVKSPTLRSTPYVLRFTVAGEVTDLSVAPNGGTGPRFEKGQ